MMHFTYTKIGNTFKQEHEDYYEDINHKLVDLSQNEVWGNDYFLAEGTFEFCFWVKNRLVKNTSIARRDLYIDTIMDEDFEKDVLKAMKIRNNHPKTLRKVRNGKN